MMIGGGMARSRRNLGRALGAAAVALSLTSFGIANALPNPYAVTPVDPGAYLVGDTVYFSTGNLTNCAIHVNGDVGCDLGQPTPLDGFVIPISVTDLAINVPFLPAHPEFGLTGPHGRPGSPQLGIWDNGGWLAASVSYAGATCEAPGNGRGALSCTSKGHRFGVSSRATVS
jgi:hypothetical protein